MSPTTESIPSISERLPDAVSTDVDAGSPVTRDYQLHEQTRDRWQQVIDEKLIEWGSNPDGFDDEEIEPPTKEAVSSAAGVARQFKEAGHPAPTRVVPDANGGIVFERQEHSVLETIRFGAAGEIEYYRFHDSRLIEHQIWSHFSLAP